MVTLFRSLLYLKEAVVNLQGKNKDIVSVVTTAIQCCEELKKGERRYWGLFPADLSA